ncbi:MAG: glycosyltransferase [Pseudomonadota bacterium]
MKLVINTTTFPASDDDPVPRFVLDQIKEMHALDPGLDIDVVVPHNAYGPKIPDRLDHSSHREFRYHYFFPRSAETLAGRGIMPALKENPLRYVLIPFFLLAQYRALLQHCKSQQPDLVYAHWFMTPAIVSYFVCKRLGIPLMFTSHASDVSVLAKVPFAKGLVARVLTYASQFTAVSNRTADKMKAFFSESDWQARYSKKLSIIPMGTALNTGLPTKEKQQKLLTDCGIDVEKRYILGMGRLSEKKGFQYLVEAYGRLDVRLREKIQLVIAGDGQLMEELKLQAKEIGGEGKVIFTGYASGELKNTLLGNASLFVLPSIVDDSGDSEGLPVAMMEALANGKMIVATNVSGAEEVLTTESGILVDQKSPELLKDAITRLLTLPADQKAQMENAARKLGKQFDWRKIASDHLKLMKRATSQ